MTLTAVSSVECQGPELAGMGSRDYKKKMEQRVGIELEEDMGLRVDFFFLRWKKSQCTCMLVVMIDLVQVLCVHYFF